MGKRINIEKISDYVRWDEFVTSSPQGTVFSSSTWLGAAAEVHGGRRVLLGAFDGDELVAGVGYVELARGPLKKATVPILSPYGGLMYNVTEEVKPQDTSSDQLLCAEKLIHYLKTRYHAVMLTHSPRFLDVRPFSWSGWEQQVRYTYVVDIAGADKEWNRFRDRVKRKIVRAAKEVTVGSTLAPGLIGELHEQMYRRKNMEPPVPGEAVAAMIGRLASDGFIDIRTALREDGSLASFQANVIGTDTIYTWVYGSVTDDGTTSADSLLIWETVKRYSATHRYLDLVGANIPSIAFFKRGFNGTLTPYYVTERYSSLPVKWAFETYTKTKKLFTR